jgi:putative addiction module component (TIGR02574 family)
MKNLSASEILKLSVSERIQLAFDLWDSIAEVPESIELTDEQMEELERRLESYHNHPEEGSPWSEVKTRVRMNS